jgi:nitrate reductase assembly molybdenum cofactor insertion protein NarJ
MRYRHQEKAAELVEELCQKEEGIMVAERAVAEVSRDYRKFARWMAEVKNRMDRAQMIYDAKQESILEIARKMKEMGDTIEKIQAVTGLPAESIERL